MKQEERTGRLMNYCFNNGCTGRFELPVPSKHNEVNVLVTSAPDDFYLSFPGRKREAHFGGMAD
jgi:hypothetical protein